MSEVGEKVAQATRQRAAVYAHLFLVLRKRLGEREAVDLMSEAIYNFGREKSTRNYSEKARSGDLAQAAREFASPDPVKQHQFAPRVVSLTPDEAVIGDVEVPPGRRVAGDGAAGQGCGNALPRRPLRRLRDVGRGVALRALLRGNPRGGQGRVRPPREEGAGLTR